MTPDTMTKDERWCLVYLESCAVERGGICEAVRMCGYDMIAIEKFKAAGMVRFGRVPGTLLVNRRDVQGEYYVELTAEGWRVAHLCREHRAEQRGPFATAVFTWIAERERVASDMPPLRPE